MGKQDRPDELIDATLDLCIRCGYENATLEQIATAACVTPDEFTRHFPTKDTALMAVIETVLHAAAAALRTVDADVGPERALPLAHTEILIAITNGRGVITRHHMIAIAQIFGSQPSLRKHASASRQAGSDPCARRANGSRSKRSTRAPGGDELVGGRRQLLPGPL